LATQIVAAVHQFERHSITVITTAAKDFADCAPHRAGNQNKLKTPTERAHKTCRKDGIQDLMKKGSEKNNRFAEDSNEYGKQTSASTGQAT